MENIKIIKRRMELGESNENRMIKLIDRRLSKYNHTNANATLTISKQSDVVFKMKLDYNSDEMNRLHKEVETEFLFEGLSEVLDSIDNQIRKNKGSFVKNAKSLAETIRDETIYARKQEAEDNLEERSILTLHDVST